MGFGCCCYIFGIAMMRSLVSFSSRTTKHKINGFLLDNPDWWRITAVWALAFERHMFVLFTRRYCCGRCCKCTTFTLFNCSCSTMMITTMMVMMVNMMLYFMFCTTQTTATATSMLGIVATLLIAITDTAVLC